MVTCALVVYPCFQAVKGVSMIRLESAEDFGRVVVWHVRHDEDVRACHVMNEKTPRSCEGKGGYRFWRCPTFA